MGWHGEQGEQQLSANTVHGSQQPLKQQLPP
jgi:hypothetical protein